MTCFNEVFDDGWCEALRWLIHDDQSSVATQTLRAGVVAVVKKGLSHSLFTEKGRTFIEALSPVPKDHIPVPERDLVLGAGGDSLHVDR